MMIHLSGFSTNYGVKTELSSTKNALACFYAITAESIFESYIP